MNNMSYYKFKMQLNGKCEERNVKMEIKEEYYKEFYKAKLNSRKAFQSVEEHQEYQPLFSYGLPILDHFSILIKYEL